MRGTEVSFEFDLCAFPDGPPCGYVPADLVWDEAVRAREGISESDLGKAVAAGVRVRRVLVVEVAATADLAPFLLLSDRPGWHHIALRRYEGPKTWGDFRLLRQPVYERDVQPLLLDIVTSRRLFLQSSWSGEGKGFRVRLGRIVLLLRLTRAMRSMRLLLTTHLVDTSAPSSGGRDGRGRKRAPRFRVCQKVR